MAQFPRGGDLQGDMINQYMGVAPATLQFDFGFWECFIYGGKSDSFNMDMDMDMLITFNFLRAPQSYGFW